MRRLLSVAAVLVVLLVVLAGALLARLARGPLSLDFLTPYVVRALEPTDGAFRIAIGATELVWTDRWYDVDLSVRDVAAIDRSGATIASLSALAMELSVPALLRGVLAPREIELTGPQLLLVREPDGNVNFGLGSPQEPGGESVFDRLFAGGDEGGAPPAARYLKRVVVQDGKLTLLDRRSGFQTEAEAVTLNVTRARGTLEVAATTTLTLGDEHIPLQAGVTRRGDGGTHLELRFDDLEPAAALRAASVLDPPPGSVAASVLETASYLQLPLSGTIRADLDENEAIRTLDVDGTATRGAILLPAPIDQRLAIERIALEVAYDAASDAVSLDHLEVDLGVPEIRVTGRWAGQEAGALVVDAEVINLPVDDLSRYWPVDAAESARTWVTTNISSGRVRDAKVALRGALSPAGEKPFDLHELRGSFAFAGLAVRYVDTMPPATGVDGTATFTTDGFDFQVATARVAGLAVPKAHVVIAGMSKPITTIAIDADTRGSLRDALALVDYPPLRYAHEIGIDPQTVSGSLNAHVKLRFPLDGAPIPDDLGVGVEAKLQGAAFPNAVGDWAVSNGDLTVAVASDVLSIRGNAQLAGVPCDVNWRETLGAKSGVTRNVDVQSRIDSEGRAALGFDLRPWVTGPAAVQARIEQRHDGKGTASVTIDLRDATLDAPDLRLVKQPGTPAQAELALALAGSKVTTISSFSFQAPETTAHGKATLGSGKAKIANLTLDGILPPATPGAPSPQFVLTLQPAPVGNRFELTSNDASTLLRLLLPDARTQGGQLKFTGQVELEAPGMPFSGDLVVRTFKLTHSPVFARLLMLASLPGIVATMHGEGLSFDVLSTQLAYASRAATFKDGVVDGPSVRIVMNGKVDSGHDDVVMDGTLVPSFYGLNTAASKIPLVGGLFGGGDGVIAIDFAIRGPVNDPKISVKPLSSIAPGVLRSLARRVPW